jgi:hypothetical protein
VFFAIAYWTLFFFIPALTMRLLAEENRTGTIEMLLTKPISDWQVVMGKFTSVMIDIDSAGANHSLLHYLQALAQLIMALQLPVISA